MPDLFPPCSNAAEVICQESSADNDTVPPSEEEKGEDGALGSNNSLKLDKENPTKDALSEPRNDSGVGSTPKCNTPSSASSPDSTSLEKDFPQLRISALEIQNEVRPSEKLEPIRKTSASDEDSDRSRRNPFQR
jgi:hypothetical protein